MSRLRQARPLWEVQNGAYIQAILFTAFACFLVGFIAGTLVR